MLFRKDELIRQVAIERPERGVLLRRVKDEVSMTLAAYQTLYEVSMFSHCPHVRRVQ